jgi:hypothetical protein
MKRIILVALAISLSSCVSTPGEKPSVVARWFGVSYRPYIGMGEQELLDSILVYEKVYVTRNEFGVYKMYIINNNSRIYRVFLENGKVTDIQY